jgi:CheY-like chemotaxis protein
MKGGSTMQARATTWSDSVHVLVVDDDPSIRSLLHDLLEDAGYEVSEAADGAAALTLLAGDEQPTVVLLDQHMPQLSGTQVANTIAQDPRLARCSTCILLTGSCDGLSLPVDLPLVSKPFDIDTLVDAVAHAAQQLQSRSRCFAGRGVMLP